VASVLEDSEMRVLSLPASSTLQQQEAL
jgi:hypothetical protein